ncbi:MAG: serine protease [Flavobacterium sp.]
MKIINANTLSFTTIPVELKFKETGKTLFTGTAFIYKYNSKFFLITNWHIVTGLKPKDKTPISDHGGIPDQMIISFLVSKNPVLYSYYPFDLYDQNISEWLIHPTLGENIDVVAIELEFDSEFEGIIRPINDNKFDENYEPEIGDDVFVLGYPYSLSGGGNFPIWKRGSIATEPDIDYEQQPKFYIDTASRPGMSGSPVIFRRIGVHGNENGQITDNTKIGEIRNFVGIYSGRVIGETNFDAQLGIVWKKRVIEEIINGNKKEGRNFI